MKIDNKEFENHLRLETKDYRQLESGLKKICLINVKLEMNLETEQELVSFRKRKREEEIQKLGNEKYLRKILNEQDFLALQEVVRMDFTGEDTHLTPQSH